MSRIGNALSSSVGKKMVMGLTGLMLVGFLVEHLLGNLKLFEDPSGKAFNDYVVFLKSFGPLLTVAEIGLAALFLAHAFLALRLTLENIQARKQGYVVRARRGGATAGSLTMFYSGALLLAYLAKHLYDFRFGAHYFEDPAGTVKATLSQPAHAFAYLLVAPVLFLHLSHGFRSAFQSLGINHPSWNPLLERLGMLVAFAFAAGFGSFPIYFLLFWRNGGHA